jgi:hypothetical protein
MDDVSASTTKKRCWSGRELATLRDRTERPEEFGRESNTILEVYTKLAPNALDALTPEER